MRARTRRAGPGRAIARGGAVAYLCLAFQEKLKVRVGVGGEATSGRLAGDGGRGQTTLYSAASS